MMNMAAMSFAVTPPTSTGYSLSLAVFASALGRMTRRYSRKPEWAHVSDRAWRRHSALLTFQHEAQVGDA